MPQKMLLIAGALHVQLVLITSVRRGNWDDPGTEREKLG